MELVFSLFFVTLAYLAGAIAFYAWRATNPPASVEKLYSFLRKSFPEWFRPRPRFYVLKDGHPVPVKNLQEWIDWFAANEKTRQVGAMSYSYKDPAGKLHKIEVTTVFLGVDHNFNRFGAPLIFETVCAGGLLHGEVFRYTTASEALEAHQHILQTQIDLLAAHAETILRSKSVPPPKQLDA